MAASSVQAVASGPAGQPIASGPAVQRSLPPRTKPRRATLDREAQRSPKRVPDFVWEQYKAPPGSKFPPTDIGVCH